MSRLWTAQEKQAVHRAIQQTGSQSPSVVANYIQDKNWLNNRTRKAILTKVGIELAYRRSTSSSSQGKLLVQLKKILQKQQYRGRDKDTVVRQLLQKLETTTTKKRKKLEPIPGGKGFQDQMWQFLQNPTR